MGDSHRADRRFTGYGPIRLRCGIRTSFRMVFASFLSLLLLLMIVFFVASCDCGFLSACIAPMWPCMAFVEGYVPLESLAFRKAGSAAPFRVALLVLDFNSSARHDRARHSSSPCSSSCPPHPHHLEGGGRTISSVPPIWGCGQGNPTRFIVGLNDTVSSAGVAPVGVVCDAPKSCDGLPVQKCGPVSLHVPNPGSPIPGSPNIGPVWSPNNWTGPESKFLDRSVSRFFSSRSGSASSWLRGGRHRSLSRDVDLRVGEV